jgi:hypothetical protein
VAKANKGIVQKIKTKIDINWNNCTGCEINLLDEAKQTYKVKGHNNYGGMSNNKYIIDINNRHFTRGNWQDYEYPCIDACAYYRFYAKNIRLRSNKYSESIL